MKRVVGGLLALIAALVVAQPAAAQRPHAGALRRGHLALVRGDDRRAQRAAGRHPRERRHAQRADVDDEHRRLHVERRGGREARASSAAPSWCRACGARSATLEGLERHADERPVLQLVRPPDRREADDLAAVRRAAGADPLVGRQRLARRRPEDRRRPRPGAVAAGAARSTTAWTSASTTGRPSTGCSSTTSRTPAARRAATTRSSARAGSPPTSASPRARCPSASTSGRTGRGRTPATRAGPRRARSASRARTSARRSTTARCPTTARSSRRAGAAACSRR